MTAQSINILTAKLGNLENWRFTGRVSYNPSEHRDDDLLCVCGQHVLYGHTIQHMTTQDIAIVGSECVKNFKSKTKPCYRGRSIGEGRRVARYWYYHS